MPAIEYRGERTSKALFSWTMSQIPHGIRLKSANDIATWVEVRSHPTGVSICVLTSFSLTSAIHRQASRYPLERGYQGSAVVEGHREQIQPPDDVW